MSTPDAATAAAATSGPPATTTSPPRRARDAFGDCALVEIIHLHDCFRGALKNLEHDVAALCRAVTAAAAPPGEGDDDGAAATAAAAADDGAARVTDLERRVAGRLTVIWSCFRAHSAAEDEFIWPALKAKQVARPPGSPPPVEGDVSVVLAAPGGEPRQQQQQRERAQSIVHPIEQEEYEEDHADEEKMFNSIDVLLSRLREELATRRALGGDNSGASSSSATLCRLAQSLLEGTTNLLQHLTTHLEKEETHCMPLVAEYLTKAEIHDLVGKIMGKRSSELMSQILTMAVENLNEADRDDMVRYMKQAMVGTFFERWLKIGGWDTTSASRNKDGGGKMSPQEQALNPATNPPLPLAKSPPAAPPPPSEPVAADKHTSAAELEKLIRAIGTNPHLDANQKNMTIQGLRDSVWKSNCRLSKRKREGEAGDRKSVM